jgi:hypothetical protein
VSPYRVRTEQLADDALVVVRGGDLDIDVIRSDAVAAHARFGKYGISVFGAADLAAVDVLARDRLAQFEVLVLMTAGTIRRAGLELRPTFRRPHYTIMLLELDRDIDRLMSCERVQRANQYYVER